MSITLEKEIERFRAEQIEGTRADIGRVNFTQVICEPREGESTFSERNDVDYNYSSPNETTLNAVREIEEGNVIRCRDEKDFFEQLNSD